MALARLSNYGRAADELNITQPALSRSIQALEDEFNVKLFDRGRSGVYLTSSGTMLAERAKNLIGIARDLQRDLSRTGAEKVGDVSFGISPLPGTFLLEDLLTDLVNNHTSIRMVIEIHTPEILLQQLKAELIEFCVCDESLIIEASGVEMSALAALPFSLLVRAGHPLAGAKSVTFSEIEDYPVVSGILSARATSNIAKAVNSEFKFTVACDNFFVLKELTLHSNAIWLSSRVMTAAHNDKTKFRELVHESHHFRHNFNLVLVTLKGRSLSPAAQLVSDKIRELFENKSVNF